MYPFYAPIDLVDRLKEKSDSELQGVIGMGKGDWRFERMDELYKDRSTPSLVAFGLLCYTDFTGKCTRAAFANEILRQRHADTAAASSG